MHYPDIVADYLDQLARELRFDRKLASRVRSEVEDHLAESISNSPLQTTEAARLAIARFGSPEELARQYAPSALLRQVRHVGAALVVAIAAIFVLMKGRYHLYQFLEWRLSIDWHGVGAIGPTIDIYAFRAALIASILGWFCIASRRPVERLSNRYWRHLKLCLVLPLAASFLLIGAVGLDAMLAVLRLLDAQLLPFALIPVGSMAIEVAIVTSVAARLVRTIHNASLAAGLVTQDRR